MSEENELDGRKQKEAQSRESLETNGDVRREQEKFVKSRQNEAPQQVKEKEQKKDRENRFVIVRHHTAETQDTESHKEVHEIRLPNERLDFLITQNEDKSLSLQTRAGAYLIVQDKPPLVKDAQTGRTMVRVLDQANNERMYDPLSGKLLPKRQEANITVVAIEVPATAGEYVEEFTETLADNIDEDSHVDLASLSESATVSYDNLTALGDEALIYEILYKPDDTEFTSPTTFLAAMEEPEMPTSFIIDDHNRLILRRSGGAAEAPPGDGVDNGGDALDDDDDNGAPEVENPQVGNQPDLSERAASEYYQEQIGTIPRPEYVGFRDYDTFREDYRRATRMIIPVKDRVFRFRQVRERLYDLQNQQDLTTFTRRAAENPDALRQEIRALKEFELSIAPRIAEGARLAPTGPTERRQVRGPRGNMTPVTAYIPGQMRFELRGGAVDGTVTFDRATDPLAEKKLIIAQYLELQQDQEKWVDDHLQDAAEVSESDEDLTLRLNAIKTSTNSFLDNEIRERYAAILTMIDAKIRFRKGGLDGLKGRGDELMTYIPKAFNLPGVPELIAEIEKREAHAQWDQHGYEYHKLGVAAQRERREATMRTNVTPDDALGEGALNITQARDARRTANRERYAKIRRSLLQKAQGVYGQWRPEEIRKLEAAMQTAKADDIDGKLALQRRLIQLKKQEEVSDLSFEAAEWWWRMAGRAAKFGDDTVPGQIMQYELACFPEWFVKKTRGWKDTYTSAFGVRSQKELVEDCLPGESKGPNLHPLWFDYVSNYSIFYPGEQSKAPFVQAYAKSHNDRITGFKKVEKELDERVQGIWDKYKHLLNPQTLDVPELISTEAMSDEDKKALDEWNSAPIMQMDVQFLRAVADTDAVWFDWADYVEKDFAGATKLKEDMGKFINEPTMKGLGDMKGEHWGRKWKARYFSKHSMETMINFRTLHARANDMGKNWGTEEVENALLDAKKAGDINEYDEEELAVERIGKTYNINTPFRKRPFHIVFHNMPEWFATGNVKTKKHGPKLLAYFWKVFLAGTKDLYKKVSPTSGGGH